MTTISAPSEPTFRTQNTPLRGPVAVLMSRFPSVTETFILREMIEMERQSQPVRVVPMLKQAPPVLHDAAKAWTARALYTPLLSAPILRANAATLRRQPRAYLSLLARLVGGTIRRPATLLRTLYLFPKSVFLARRLEAEGVRHVHAHFATHPTTMALIIATLTDITFSFTVHAHDIQLDHSLLRWKVREARFIRSISAFNRRYLERLYPAEAAGKIEVIHVGIEPDVYERVAAGAKPAAGPPLLLCVAAHKPYKGLPYLIEACRMLRDRGHSFRCEIVGHGPMHDELESQIRRDGLSDWVRLAGPRPQEEVARLMAEATLFVLPSIVAPDGQMEGIPVALMEAMAAARPVVSTTIAGIPELIDDGESGILVPPASPDALAAAIESILGDAGRSAQLGAKARAKVRREFALDVCVQKLVALLDREAAPEPAR